MSFGNSELDLSQQNDEQQPNVEELKESLLENEDKFRILTESAPVGIFLDDAQGKAFYINKKCAELIGVPAEDALNFNWIPYLHPDDRERMVSEWKKAYSNSTEFHLEYRWLHEDGSIVWTLGEVIPIVGEGGKATMFVGTLTDITAQKEAELEREALQAQLIQAQKMESVGRLAGGVAHDYNNMLSVILGNAEVAMTEVGETHSAYECLQEVVKAAKHSTEVTRQLLTFARKQVVSPECFDMNESVADMLKMIGHLIGEDIELDCSPHEGQILIKMDSSQFDRIVVNLCVNARDAITGGGRITIETEALAFDEAYCAEHMGFLPGEFGRLSVRDNGSGMDEVTLNNIFEPFFTTKKENMGTGLGLASVYGTIKQNDGFIDVQSEPGVGSSFNIYLPRHTGPTSTHKPLDPAPDYKSEGETVLVVEDEAAILKILGKILHRHGCRVLSARTSSEALDLARDHPEDIDLLITDVVMPEINGKDLAKQLSARRPEMKTLFMSGYTADVIARQGLLEEKVHFIQKPFTRKELIEKVQETLNEPGTHF